MAVEVVYNVADEWLAELDEDSLRGMVDRRLVRVTIGRRAATDGPLDHVLVQAGYTVGGVAVRLERPVGYVPRGVQLGSDMDAEKVGVRATAVLTEVESRVRDLGLSVRAGRLVTVG